VGSEGKRENGKVIGGGGGRAKFIADNFLSDKSRGRGLIEERIALPEHIGRSQHRGAHHRNTELSTDPLNDFLLSPSSLEFLRGISKKKNCTLYCRGTRDEMFEMNEARLESTLLLFCISYRDVYSFFHVTISKNSATMIMLRVPRKLRGAPSTFFGFLR